MRLNINPFNMGNPMTLKDAAIVSAIAALTVWILQFFANAQYVTITSNPGAWCFEALKNYLVTWAGIFIALSGLDQLIKQAKPKEGG